MKRLSILFFLIFAPFSLWSENNGDVYLGFGLGYEHGNITDQGATAWRLLVEYDYSYPLTYNFYLVPAVQLSFSQMSSRAAPTPPVLSLLWLNVPLRFKYELLVKKNAFFDIECGIFGGMRLAGCDDITDNNKYYHESNRFDTGPVIRIGPRFNRLSFKFEGQFGLCKTDSSVRDNLSFISLLIGYRF